MRKIRNITVAVTPELYRQTRRLAALKAAGHPVTAPASQPVPCAT